jgi:hypothetical protein
MTRALSALALVLVLIGCAGKPTPYQPKADRTGYSQQQLDTQTWRVQFAGNIDTPRETVENYLLYRSAEIMLFGGYQKFVMLEKDIERNVEYWDTGYYPHFGYGLHHGRHHGYHHGLSYYGPTRYSPLVSYSGTATIRIYSGGPPPNNAPVYDAQEIVQQLGPTIVLPQAGSG